MWTDFNGLRGVNVVKARGRKEKRAEKVFEEIMAPNFQNVVNDLNLQIP